MAVLEQSDRIFDIVQDGTPEAGLFAAKVVEVRDLDNHTVTSKFGTRTGNYTAILFGYYGTDGKRWKIATRELSRKLTSKSTIKKIWNAAMGREPVAGQSDTQDLKGRVVMLNVTHNAVTGEDGQVRTYANIDGVFPCPADKKFGPPAAAPAAPAPAATPPPAPAVPDDGFGGDDEEVPF